MPTPVHVGTPGNGELSVWYLSVQMQQEGVRVAVWAMSSQFYCTGLMLASPAKKWDRSLWVFCFLSALISGIHDQGAVGGAGRLRPLGAPLPEIDPQR